MTAIERAHAISAACAPFTRYLGETSSADLLEYLRLELGSERILDQFVPIGTGSLRAIAPRTILHIVAGNTPHAALQSLVRGLLLGSHNCIKLPGAGLPEVDAFYENLPPVLRDRVEIFTSLPDDWFPAANAIIVFGADETVEHFRALARPHQFFIGYGHRVSLGVVFGDPEFKSVTGAALDVSLFDQQGCLSPHCLYVAGDAGAYAMRLAVEMERIQAAEPRSPLTISEAAAIAELRESTRFRIALGQPARLWESPGSNAWTVILDPDPAFAQSTLNRTIFIRPLPADLAPAIASIRQHLSTIAIWPNTEDNAARAVALGASRVCEIGCMQYPAWTWRHDGRQTLAPLVSWCNWERPQV